MDNELRKYGTKLVRSCADALADGITTGHDWPNNQAELTRLQGAKLLRECAKEIEDLRNWARMAFHALNHVGPALLDQEPETSAEADLIQRVRELATAAAQQYPTIANVRWQDAEFDARGALKA